MLSPYRARLLLQADERTCGAFPFHRYVSIVLLSPSSNPGFASRYLHSLESFVSFSNMLFSVSILFTSLYFSLLKWDFVSLFTFSIISLYLQKFNSFSAIYSFQKKHKGHIISDIPLNVPCGTLTTLCIETRTTQPRNMQADF